MYILSFYILQDSTDDVDLVAAVSQAEATMGKENISNPRFENIQEEDVDRLLDEQKNKRTKLKTEGHIRLLKDFLSTRGEVRLPEAIPPNDMNKLLALFFLSVKKTDGTDYEPGSLKGMQGSFERHLKERGYTTSLVTSIHFEKSRAALASKQKQLKKRGKGNKPKAAQALTDEERNTLYTSRQLGTHSPMALINTIWLNLTIHFGLRGVDEHRKLSWGDLVMGTDHTGQSYIEFNERETKTRTGMLNTFFDIPLVQINEKFIQIL